MSLSRRTIYSCILVPDVQVFSAGNLQDQGAGTTASSYPEANLEPICIPDSANGTDENGRYLARIIPSGSPSAAFTMDALLQTPGFPNENAAMVYTTDGGSTYRGQVIPDVMTGLETIQYDTSSNGYREPRLVSNWTTGALYCVAEYWFNDTVVFLKRASAGAQWTVQGTIWTSGLGFTSTSHACPDAVLLSSGRLVVASLEQIGTKTWLRLDYSDNEGVSWSNMGRKLLALDNATDRYDLLRLTYDAITQNYVLAVRRLSGSDYSSITYLSNTGGAAWVELDTIDTIWAHDLATTNGVTLYATCDQQPDGYVRFRRMSGQAGGWRLQPTVQGTPTAYSGELSLTTTPAGHFVFMSRGYSAATTLATIHVWSGVSIDAGRTWGTWGSGWPYTSNQPVYVYQDSGSASGLRCQSIAFHNGAIYMAGVAKSFVPIDDSENTLWAAVFGGIQNVTDRTPFDFMYVPVDDPGNRGWTAVGGGATGTQFSGGSGRDLYTWRISGSTGQTLYYRRNTTSTGATTRSRFMARAATGGSAANDDIVFSLKSSKSGGGSSCGIKIRLAASGTHAVVDAFSGITIATVSATALAWVEWIVAIDHEAQVGSVWWRNPESQTDFTVACSGTALSASGSTTDERLWGHATSAASATSYWVWMGFIGRTGTTAYDDGLANGQSLSDMTGITVTTAPTRLPAEGVYLSGRGGPFFGGDAFQIKTRSRTGFHRAVVNGNAASPRIGFESGVTTAGATGKYATFDAGPEYSRQMGSLIGLCGLSCAVKSLYLQRYFSGVWTTIATLDPSERPFGAAGSVRWFRDLTTDGTFRPDGTNGYPRYFRQDELRGAIIAISNDGSAHTCYWRVTGNTEGQFSNAAGVKQMLIFTEVTPLSGTSASLGTSATTGDILVYWPDSMVITEQTESTFRYMRLMFDFIPGLTTASIGKVVAGPLSLFAKQVDAGSQWTFVSNDVVTERPFGFKTATRDAPMARSVRFPWRDLLMSHNRYKGGTAVSTVNPTGSGVPHAIQDNNVDVILAHMEQFGRTYPLVFVPAVELTANPYTTPKTIYGKNAIIYGRMAPEVTVTVKNGLRFADGSSGAHILDTEWSVLEET